MRPGARSGRTYAGSRTTRRRAGSPRSRRRPPTTRAGRSSRRQPCSRSRRRRRGRGRASTAASSSASPSAPLCDEKPIVPGGSRARRERRVQARPGDRDAEAVRPDQPRAVRADEREQPLLALEPLAPGLGEPGRDHDEGPDTAGERLLGRLDHAGRRDADDGQVDRIGDLGDRRGSRARRQPRPPSRLTGKAAPAKSASRMFRKSSPPIVPRRRDAPITATLRGSKNGRSDAVTATWSRSATSSSNRSVRCDREHDLDLAA